MVRIPSYVISLATLFVLSIVGVITFLVTLKGSYPDDLLTGQWSAPANQRDNLSIIWSCLITVLIYTWTIFHPDIDAHQRGNVVVSRRTRWFVVGVFAPEFIAITAMVQFLRVWALRRQVVCHDDSHESSLKERSWMQYFYADMGGFAIRYRNSDGTYTRTIQLSLESIIAISENGIIPLFDIAPEEIKDRSKADWLAKVITLCQVVWFCAQAIGRAATGLPITTLELVTLAFVATSAATIAFWWKKPLDINMPTVITLRPGDIDTDLLDGIPELSNLIQTGSLDMPLVGQVDATNPSELKQSFRQQVHNVSQPIVVNTRLAPYIHFNIVTLLSAVFGVVHLIAIPTGFAFPTPTENSLWFAASLSTTILPPCLYTLYYAPLQNRTFNYRKDNSSVSEIMRYVVLTLTGGIYFFSRAYLLFEPFFALRKVEKGTYDQLRWIQHWPHVH